MAASIATWTFGYVALKSISSGETVGANSIDMVQNSIKAIEEDEKLGPYSVGHGGMPNSSGVLQLDAAIMDGKELEFGAVLGMEGIKTPICVARKVMTNSPANMLVGTGAQEFAKSNGFTVQKEGGHSLTEHAKNAYQDYLSSSVKPAGHDTLGVIVLDASGNISAGVSTSGRAFKPPGRVGDSALPGCGLYADNDVGAACCTGDGDEILKFCPAIQVINKMRMGHTPDSACEEVIRDIATRRKDKKMFEIGIIAMDMKGNTGAGCSFSSWTDDVTEKLYPGFPYATWKEDQDCQLEICPSSIS